MKNISINLFIESILNKAGIKLNGNQPQDIRIKDERALLKIARKGSLGLGESYMAGWWECDRIDELANQLCKANLETEVPMGIKQALFNLSSKLINYQNKYFSKQVAQKHYNLDNHLFELMLGPSMAYSCGYWKEAKDLDAAQYAKFDLICKKINLNENDKLLDIGCGWGGFAAYAAERYGCQVTGISIAAEQINYAKEQFKQLPIQFYCTDYRDIQNYNPNNERFSKIVSIGACEHIGHKNYENFFEIAKNQLDEEGLFLLHTIGSNITVTTVDPWIHKYIFPNGRLPSMLQLSKAIESRFIMEDWHNFGADYDKTLMAWNENFENHWDELKSHFDFEFYRMWRYYLLTCAGMFRSRTAQLWQLVLSKHGVKGGYESIR